MAESQDINTNYCHLTVKSKLTTMNEINKTGRAIIEQETQDTIKTAQENLSSLQIENLVCQKTITSFKFNQGRRLMLLGPIKFFKDMPVLVFPQGR